MICKKERSKRMGLSLFVSAGSGRFRNGGRERERGLTWRRNARYGNRQTITRTRSEADASGTGAAESVKKCFSVEEQTYFCGKQQKNRNERICQFHGI